MYSPNRDTHPPSLVIIAISTATAHDGRPLKLLYYVIERIARNIMALANFAMFHDNTALIDSPTSIRGEAPTIVPSLRLPL